MARCLHLLRAREELAEDPFRGLRAGPADFSPFLLPKLALLFSFPTIQLNSTQD